MAGLPGILGVDFSHWQGKPDCAKLKEAGVYFGIVKAGETLVRKPGQPLFNDKQHDRNIAGLKANDIISGDYYYFHPSAGASVQARHYAGIYNRTQPDLPPVVDVEDHDGMLPKDVAKQLFAFIDQLREKIGREPIVYSTNSFLVSRVGNPDWQKQTLFWIARYNTSIKDLSVKIKESVIMWQFTDRLKLPGLPAMDGNYWLRSREELSALAGKQPVISNPLPGLEEVYFRLGIRSRYLEKLLRGA
jgi:GH25 family lysozyme M1 (1,4-beta-N-acetylmuramidase)